MIIQVKTLQNVKFDLEIELTDTVAQIKERIHKELNLGEPETQKLIHRGKILKDDQTAQSKEDTEETEQTTSSETTTTTTATTTTTSSSPLSTSQSTTTNPNQASEQSASSTLVTGVELQSTVQNLMNMGFDREQVMQALRAAYNNPDRAVEYLINGIPNEPQQAEPPSEPPANTRSASLGQQSRQAPRTTSTQPQSTQSSQAQSGGGAQNPMAQLQQAIQGNPQLLAGMIAQLAQQNPELLQAIQQNPQALQQVLNDPQIMQQLMGMMLLQQLQQGGGGDEEDGYEDDGSGDANPLGGINPPAGVIQVTSAEKQAIDRLRALVGCSEAQAAEAYMVCDKNEELAASYLVENSLGTSAFDLPRTTGQSNQSQNQSSQSRNNNSGNDNSDNTGTQNDDDI